MPVGIDAVGGAQRVPQSSGDQTQQLVADRMAERVVDSLEVVEIEIQHREHPLELLGRHQRARQAVAGLLTVRQAGESVEVGELHDAVLGAPFARQRDRHLTDFVRMKRLLQVRQLLLGRHHAAHFARDRRPNRPCTGRFQWPDRVRECAPRPTRRRDPAACACRETRPQTDPPRRSRRAPRRPRPLRHRRTSARSTVLRAVSFLDHLLRSGLGEQPVAQIAEHGRLAAHVGLEQNLPIRVAHLGLVVRDENSNRYPLGVCHGCTSTVHHVSRSTLHEPPTAASNASKRRARALRLPPKFDRPSAADRIRAPMQSNPVIGVPRFGGKALVEYALEVLLGECPRRCPCNADAAARGRLRERFPPPRAARPVSRPASRTASAALMMRFCSTRRSTVRATRTTPTLRSDSSASTTSRWRQASGTISSVCVTRSGRRTDSTT